MKSTTEVGERVAPRQDLAAPVEFFIGGGVYNGMTVNKSETGFCIDSKKPISIVFHFGEGTQEKVFRTKLIWASQKEEGSVRLGLKIIEEFEMRLPL